MTTKPHAVFEDDDLETMSVIEAGRHAGLGKNAAYAAAKRGEIPVMRFGRKMRVSKARFRKKMLEEG